MKLTAEEILSRSGIGKEEMMVPLWDAFLEDFGKEIWDWTLREILKAFWYYCEYGPEAVTEWAERRTATESGEGKNETGNAESF